MIRNIRALFAFAKPKISFLLLSLFATVISVAGALYAPLIIGDAVNCMVAEGEVDFALLHANVIKLIAVLSCSVLGKWVSEFFAARACFAYGYELRKVVFAHFMRLPVKEFDTAKRGDLMQRITGDVTKISSGYLQGLRQLQNGVLTILGTLGIMIAINFKLALILAFLTPLSMVVSYFIGKYMRKSFAGQARLNGEVFGFTEEKINGFIALKTCNKLGKTCEGFDKINSELYHQGFNAQFSGALTNPCTRFVNAVIYAAICTVGALLIVEGGGSLTEGALTVGTLSAALSYANQYTKPFNDITGILNELYSASASAERVAELLNKPLEQEVENVAIDKSDDRVKFDDVSFSYVPEKPLIQHFDFVAEKGAKVAIVGPTGCGKTTLINLIMRFYDPVGGRIMLGDKPVTEASRQNVRDMYGMVLQDTWIMTATVRDNIAFFKRDATDEQVETAAERAGAAEFIKKLPKGYDTVLGKDSSLSEGQKQLICIARVMLDVPPMLLLDEATSSIDSRTEKKLTKAFVELTKGRTSFVVAHRLSTILDSDVILVMKDGKIIERGTHAELLSADGFYAKMYRSQYVG